MIEAGDNIESLFEAPAPAEQERMVEAILFASAEPVTIAELNARMPHGANAAEAVQILQKRYDGRGVAIVKTGDAWAIRTAPDLGFLMQKENGRDPKAQPRCNRNACDYRLSSTGYPHRDRRDTRRQRQPRHRRSTAGTGMGAFRAASDDTRQTRHLRSNARGFPGSLRPGKVRATCRA